MTRETVMITGASSGIGLAAARLLAGDGYSVIATSRSLDRLEGLRQEAEEQGLPIRTVELDINSDASVEEVMPGLVRDAGGIDALVNNAGYGLRGPLHSVSTKEIRAQFETNVFAALRLTRAVLPVMVEQGQGHGGQRRVGGGAYRHAIKRRVFGEQVRAGGHERVDEDGTLAARE